MSCDIIIGAYRFQCDNGLNTASRFQCDSFSLIPGHMQPVDVQCHPHFQAIGTGSGT